MPRPNWCEKSLSPALQTAEEVPRASIQLPSRQRGRGNPARGFSGRCATASGDSRNGPTGSLARAGDIS